MIPQDITNIGDMTLRIVDNVLEDNFDKEDYKEIELSRLDYNFLVNMRCIGHTLKGIVVCAPFVELSKEFIMRIYQREVEDNPYENKLIPYISLL